MSDPYDPNQWIRDRIAAKKAQLLALDEAITKVASGAQSYQLNTGQSQQLVTKANLGSMRLVVKDLEADILALEARLGCGSSTQGRLAW